MTVVAVLIGLITPGLGKVQETARRAACGSTQRQIGLGIFMYAEDHKDQVPKTVFTGNDPANDGDRKTQKTMIVRNDEESALGESDSWDGIGWLYAEEYLNAPKIFYCPSHHGDHRFRNYADSWGEPAGLLVGNFHYRGEGPNGSTRLSEIEPPNSALLADGMWTIDDYNHVVGTNVLRADLAVRWFADNGTISMGLARNEDDSDSDSVDAAWEALDDNPPE